MVKRTYGQFQAIERAKSELNHADRQILKAFHQGEDAGRSDQPCRCPYMPSSEQAKAEAWLAGYNETATRYVIANAPDLSDKGGEAAGSLQVRSLFPPAVSTLSESKQQ
jgi:hypothetical protein